MGLFGYVILDSTAQVSFLSLTLQWHMLSQNYSFVCDLPQKSDFSHHSHIKFSAAVLHFWSIKLPVKAVGFVAFLQFALCCIVESENFGVSVKCSLKPYIYLSI